MERLQSVLDDRLHPVHEHREESLKLRIPEPALFVEGFLHAGDRERGQERLLTRVLHNRDRDVVGLSDAAAHLTERVIPNAFGE